jgi:hypothetical protein
MPETNDSRTVTRSPKKLLALDGGGIRGVLSLGILAAMEKTVGKPLGEYFDYIAGTSTGAIIAAGLAKGLPVSFLLNFYREFGPAMFEPRFLLRRYKSLYTSDPLKAQLQKVFGLETTLGSPDLKSKLLIVTRNWTTDSPWPVSNNPDARYNQRTRPDCNLMVPLWQLVRASTAAPVYFPPEVLNWDSRDPSKSFVFVDGGVTPYNNPAFLLFRMATNPAYCLNWETGENKLLLTSVGTGSAPKMGAQVDDSESSIPGQIPGLISALMYGAGVDQDINCRTVGRCIYGNLIDRELGDMIPRDGNEYDFKMTLEQRLALPKKPIGQDLGKAFLYARYNPELTDAGMADLGVENYNLDSLLKMDAASEQNIENLYTVGLAMGNKVDKSHFGSFL